MANLKFADTHNLVVFLSKPIECKGFEQIVDFLNAHLINYALTVNPTIYTSCINQFWSTGLVKTIDGEVQLHALVDGKRIIISKASVRRDLKLEDERLAKTTAWNEFSSTMASAIICLDTNQKFNFSKYIFESMVRNLDNVSGKILMYPRLLRNMKEGEYKDFSVRVTTLFPSMVVQNQSKMGEGSAMPTDPHHTPTITQSSPQPQKTQKPRKPKRKDTQVPQPSGPTEHVADEAVHKERGDSLVRAATTASSLEAEHDKWSGIGVYNTCNNDKNLSEIQLEHEKEDELVVVMVVKEIEDGLLEEIEKFGWWFEQDIDGESKYDNEKKLVMVNEEGDKLDNGSNVREWQSMV
ncbi:hypothetical protein Tco_0740722 [Tanacetum coccineum]